jgi:short-subunit dehydrogenase
LEGAAQDFQALGTNVTEVRADLATKEGVRELWSKAQQLGRPVDVACLNAGVGVGGLFWQTDLDAELNMVYLNCAGTVQLAKYVVQEMVNRGTGRILFTASIAGEMVAPREAVYAASKAFVLSFAHSLRYELRDTGVTVTALQPGPTDTDFFHRAGMDDTEVGQKGKSESNPDDVARQGLDALFEGKDHIYAAAAKTKMEGMLANAIPGALKGAMHEKMAKPNAER